ncbi:helix-turn-helix domain-containing protein [Pseudonocardia acidicola]|uniref:Sigma-54 factor interaction domain-containing protein n=1 Tax=Pseudonocardia acidicola TaxID=2724939 RepID=A0ABX1SAP7_9PSEU|nr:helix-turn-helix domain-containing protein [Pseudonocardia acidicola]NMH97937.1 hypothetical protein [Pseudonocardia acidicola]
MSAPVRPGPTRIPRNAPRTASQAGLRPALRAALQPSVQRAHEPEAEGLTRDPAARTERLLLDAYLRSRSRLAGRPVTCVSERTIISNPVAARLFHGVSQAMLWEQAARAIASGRADSCEFPLADGRTVVGVCRPIDDHGRVIGAVIEAAGCDEPPRGAPTRVRATVGAGEFAGLAGQGEQWREMCAEAVHARDSGLPILVRGEVGTGKLSLLTALFGAERVRVMDAALVPVDGFTAWARELRERLAEPGAVVVVRRLECLEPPAAQTVCSLLDLAHPDVRPAGTLTLGAGAGEPFRPLLRRFAVATIDVPALRRRLDDLPQLLAALSLRVEGRPRRWMPEAVQALSRLEWTENIRELENVVRRVIAGCPAGDIRARHLPDEVLTDAPRRRLTQLEQLEFTEMLSTLRRTGGNKKEAAQILEISRSTLYRKMRQFGMDLTRSAF